MVSKKRQVIKGIFTCFSDELMSRQPSLTAIFTLNVEY